MIRVTAFYAYSEDVEFNWDYYRNKHLPMVRELLGEKLLGLQVERGLRGLAPTMPPLYLAMAQLDFASEEVLQELMLGAVPKIVADIPNYTAATLQIQIGELLA